MKRILVVLTAVAAFASLTTAPASADTVQTWGNAVTKRCLDDSDLGLRTVECNGQSFQNWITRPNPDGVSSRLENEATHRCLDYSPAGLRTFACNDAIYQRVTYVQFTAAIRMSFQGVCLDDSLEFGLRPLACNSTEFQAWGLTE